jgi:hypothetical protein
MTQATGAAMGNWEPTKSNPQSFKNAHIKSAYFKLLKELLAK